MSTPDHVLVIVMAVIVASMWWNAKEAHQHAHELACHVDHPLCKFHKPE